jgi:biotin operon repressor
LARPTTLSDEQHSKRKFIAVDQRIARVVCVHLERGGCVALTASSKLLFALLEYRKKYAPRIAGLAQDLGCSQDSIARAISRLERAGLVKAERHRGRKRPNVYELVDLETMELLTADGWGDTVPPHFFIEGADEERSGASAFCECDTYRCGCLGVLKRDRGMQMPGPNGKMYCTTDARPAAMDEAAGCGSNVSPQAAATREPATCGKESATCGDTSPQPAGTIVRHTLRDNLDTVSPGKPGLTRGSVFADPAIDPILVGRDGDDDPGPDPFIMSSPDTSPKASDHSGDGENGSAPPHCAVPRLAGTQNAGSHADLRHARAGCNQNMSWREPDGENRCVACMSPLDLVLIRNTKAAISGFIHGVSSSPAGLELNAAREAVTRAKGAKL